MVSETLREAQLFLYYERRNVQASVVDRHLLMLIRIRIGHSILMPIQIRIRIDPKLYTCWKIGIIFTFIHTRSSLLCFIFLISVIGAMIFNTLDSILKFFGKTSKILV
jgi:hypothetical protein